MAGNQACLWRAVPMEHAVHPGDHGEIPQVAHLPIGMGHSDLGSAVGLTKHLSSLSAYLLICLHIGALQYRRTLG